MNVNPVHVAVTVVVEHEARFLMTEELRSGEPVWYFPSGALEPGESLEHCARGEVLEETGYAIRPLSILRIDHGVFVSKPDLFWWCYVISARLRAVEPEPVRESDIVAVGWMSLDDIATLRLRNEDARRLATRTHSVRGLNIAESVLASDGRLEGFYA